MIEEPKTLVELNGLIEDDEEELRRLNERLERNRALAADYNSVIENVGELRRLNDEVETLSGEDRERVQGDIDRISDEVRTKRLGLPEQLQEDLQQELRRIYLDQNDEPVVEATPEDASDETEETPADDDTGDDSDINDDIFEEEPPVRVVAEETTPEQPEENVAEEEPIASQITFDDDEPDDEILNSNDQERIREAMRKHEKAYRDAIDEMMRRYEEFRDYRLNGLITAEDVRNLDKVEAEYYRKMFELNDVYLREKRILDRYRERDFLLSNPNLQPGDNVPKEDTPASEPELVVEEKRIDPIVGPDPRDEISEPVVEEKKMVHEAPVEPKEPVIGVDIPSITPDPDKKMLPPAQKPGTKMLPEGKTPEDDKNQVKKPIDKPENTEVKEMAEKVHYRTLEEILDDIKSIYEPDEDGLGTYANISKRQTARYDRSSIKVTKMFTNDVHTKNFWYNLVNTAPGLIIRIPVNTIRKITGKLFLTKKAKEEIEAVKKNIDNLSDADLEVLSREYKGKTAENFVTNAAIDGYIRDAIVRYQYRKEIEPRRATLVSDYQKMIASYNAYEDARLELMALEKAHKEGNTEVLPRIKELRGTMQRILEGKEPVIEGVEPDGISQVERIKRIQETKQGIQDLQSSGIHGTAEDIKSKRAKRNRKGWLFSVGHNTGADEAISKREAKLSSALQHAVNKGDDRNAMAIFMEKEKLEAINTTEERRILRGGVVSTGVREYDPLVQELDYSQDMFFRNLMSTIAIAGAAVNLVTNIHNVREQHRLEERDAEIDAANKHNHNVNDQVHQKGEQLYGNKDKVEKSLEYDRARTESGIQNVHELTDNRRYNWNQSRDGYIRDDLGHHHQAEELFSTTRDEITKLQQQLRDGKISDVEFLQRMNGVNHELHSGYNQAIQEGLDVLEKYSKEHPDIELDALIENYRIMATNHGAIDAGLDVAVESVGVGKDLLELSFKELANLDPDIAVAWTPLIATVLLAGYTGSQADARYRESNDAILDEIKTTARKDAERDMIIEELAGKRKETPKEEKAVSEPQKDVAETVNEEPKVEKENEIDVNKIFEEAEKQAPQVEEERVHVTPARKPKAGKPNEIDIDAILAEEEAPQRTSSRTR